MIASLTGVVEKTLPGQVILNVHGVGYLVHVTMNTFTSLPPVGESARLATTMIVREDDISLYGFSSEAEKWLFTLLQEVSGVGPKLALKILSGLEPRRLRDALSGGDLAMLSSISGVGKKLAQRLVVELKDKVGSFEGMMPAPELPGQAGPAEKEAVDALVALGYQQRVARRAVDEAALSASGVEALIREALKLLAPKR